MSMDGSHNAHFALEDLLSDLQAARQLEQLGRLALLAYCDVKRWARQSGKTDVADLVMRMFSENPCLSKDDFLQGMDHLIRSLQWHEGECQRSSNHSSSSTALASCASVRH